MYKSRIGKFTWFPPKTDVFYQSENPQFNSNVLCPNLSNNENELHYLCNECVNNLNSEINKYKCPKCETGLAGVEETNSQDVYPNSHLQFKDSKATAKENPKSRKDERVIQSFTSYEDYIKKLEDEKDKCKKLQEINKEYALRITNLEETLSEREVEIKKLQTDNTKLQIENNQLQENNSQLQENNSQLQENNNQLQDEKKSMAETMEGNERKLKDKLRETDERRAGLQKEIESLKGIEKRQRMDIENFKKTIEENEILINNLYTKDSKQERIVQELRRELEGMNNNLEQTRIEKDTELRRLNEKCAELERDIEKKSRREIAVGFSATLAPSMSTILLDGLMAQLAQRLAVERVDLVRRPFYGNADFNCPLLAVCVNVSRIGADAKEALKGIAKVGNQKDVVLLVFHHKEAHALPSQSSDKLLTGTEFSHLGTIIDLAFLSQRGIYECDMNTMGIERIVSFLLQYKKQKQ